MILNCANVRRFWIKYSREGCNAIVEKDRDRIIAACGSSTIPEGIRSIASGAFYAVSVTEIFIPRSVTEIADLAF